MSTPRFDGFYYDGHYFEADWNDAAVTWPCHRGCNGQLFVPMARLWQQKLGAITLHCPTCHSPWQIEITNLSHPLRGDITELNDQPANGSFFPSSPPPSLR